MLSSVVSVPAVCACEAAQIENRDLEKEWMGSSSAGIKNGRGRFAGTDKKNDGYYLPCAWVFTLTRPKTWDWVLLQDVLEYGWLK